MKLVITHCAPAAEGSSRDDHHTQKRTSRKQIAARASPVSGFPSPALVLRELGGPRRDIACSRPPATHISRGARRCARPDAADHACMHAPLHTRLRTRHAAWTWAPSQELPRRPPRPDASHSQSRGTGTGAAHSRQHFTSGALGRQRESRPWFLVITGSCQPTRASARVEGATPARVASQRRAPVCRASRRGCGPRESDDGGPRSPRGGTGRCTASLPRGASTE